MRKYPWITGMLLLLLLPLLTLGGAAVIQAQADDPLPPHVIDVWPLPGVELSPDEPLTLTFDQPMDQASVEAAWGVEPALAGTFDWPDARTVNFQPEGEWPRATVYNVTLGETATAANGLTLQDPYRFEAQTIGALVVTAVTPEDGTEGVAADARIVVTFNRPVVPLVSTEQLADLPVPVTIDPALDGVGEWLNTSIYAFTPSEPLQGGSTYTVTVEAGLTTVTGAALEEAVSWSFRTLPPQILSVSPSPNSSGIVLDADVIVRFSQPMDHASSEEAFHLLYGGEYVVGDVTWNSDSTTMTFSPSDRLRIDSTYLVNIAPTARSAAGDATLDEGQSITFYTVPLPGISSTSPGRAEVNVSPGRGAAIYFRSPMNTETFADRVRIDPEPAAWSPAVSGNATLYLQFASLPNTTYTITFLAGAEDIYGNAIETDYTFVYVTGSIRNRVYPLTNYESFAVTGAHRQDTRFSIAVSGTPTVEFELYQVERANLHSAIQQYFYDERPAWATEQALLRRWTTTFDSQGQQNVPQEVLLASEQGGTLPNGVYWVVMRWNDNGNTRWYQFALTVATANLTVKRAPDEMLIWVTDMPTAEPVPGAAVTVYRNGQAIARGQTDADGVLRAPVEANQSGLLLVVAESQDTYAVWHTGSAQSLPGQQDYLYTDRPIYRPGQTVYFRGVLRDRQDMDYSVPNQRAVHVRVDTVYSGQRLYEADVDVTDFGTFSGEFELAADAPLESVSIYARDAYVQFTIAEFRVPEFEVTVAPQQDELLAGRELNALVTSSFYFGGPVSGAELRWNAWGEPAFFHYTGPGRYTFTDNRQDWFYYELGGGQTTTDASGQFLVTSSNTQPPTRRPMTVTVEATVTDESRQAISGRASVLVHPANVYVGQRTDRYFGRAGQPMSIDLIAVNVDSEPLPAHRIDLTVVEIRWEREPVDGQFGRYTWTSREIEVETAEVTTGADGTTSYSFTPPNGGIFRVLAEAMDEYERVNGSTLRFWATGSNAVWWGEPSQTIDLIADQDSYQPGDTAQVLVPIPFAGASTVLVSVERAGILWHEVIAVEGSTLLYELPISEAHVPTVYVEVTVVKGIDDESLNPDYRTGRIQINVEPVEQQLTVTVVPSADLTQPRDTVTFDVLATDAHGEPVQAEFGLALTDKAILSLMPPNSGPLVDAYWGQQRNYVYTGHSLTALLDRITDQAVPTDELARDADDGAAADMALGGAMVEEAEMASAPAALSPGGEGNVAQQPGVTVREEFEQTPLWQAHVVTGADGRASVSVDLPDNLTTWTLDARALTVNTEVGQTTAEIVTTLPLLVRPVAPRFMVVGDRLQLAAVVNNNTPDAQTVAVTLEAEGVMLEADAMQTVTIEAGARARVEWWVEAQDVPYADLTFIAIGADGYQDAVRPTLATGPDGTIPIYRYTAPDTTGTGGILREGGSRTEAISLPPRLDADQGELVVHVDPSLAVTATDAFNYLRSYPHQCIEQTVSRFLPNAVTFAALQDLGLQDPALEADLYNVLTDALERLRTAQNPDGGWGWFARMESNPLVTAYAALGLAEARVAGFDIDSDMINRALNYVRQQLIQPRMETSRWQLNRQAFYLYVLSRAGQDVFSEMQALHQYRIEMSYMARAYLLLAYLEQFPQGTDTLRADLVSDLTTAAILSATGVHWEEDWNDWWNWSSDTRTTAVVLQALIKAMPESDLLPNAVRWLMVARQGDHWVTTQETAWAVMALTDWMVLTGELQGNYDYSVNLNREDLGSATVTPDSVRDGQVLRVAVSDLLLDEVNRLVVVRSEGDGALYYTAHLDLRLPASEVDAISRGITVNREYFLADDPDTRISAAQVGDIITVRVTMTLTQDIYYFVLEDPIPAGTEGVDTSLLTTSQQAQDPTLRSQRDPYWWWGWWWFDHTEMRDEQVNLYADFLPRGTYVYTYQVRASTPGEFQTMPSHAYAFYFPEVFGRADGTLFTVTPEDSE